ncbi:hypothetical protein K431DRAFT_336498 [Polychaeton citri CBS 116435]|uniref:Uncharacterized protein n=1 Tax=Polychaeton citri CBS 116435 TaxID=1314669 RepID=A0A9P4QHN6_9PEZI|nr:hypothetical protein K431DRAFT_336498 [Polychaeton citri CBS 116435]
MTASLATWEIHDDEEFPPAYMFARLNTSATLWDADGPPSSPFVSVVEARSRIASAEHELLPQAKTTAQPQEVTQTLSIGSLERRNMLVDFEDDKENTPQSDNTSQKLISSPKNSAPPPVEAALFSVSTPRREQAERRGSKDSELMPPPPSMPKTPRRSPLKPTQSAANTPRPVSRNGSLECSEVRTPQQFQSLPDMRASTHHRDDPTNVDDSCVSDFSQIPEMTLFARLGQSPTKRDDMLRTPRATASATPSTSRKRASPSRSPSPTPRRPRNLSTTNKQDKDGTQTFLIDFTEQIQGVGRPSASLSPSKTESDLLHYINSQRSPAKSSKTRHSYATPAKQNNILNLLDFELPPAPTPRSVPTITVRELESLKSSYMSQISNLKATLSGKEAEVDSLKKAIGDAERRAAEAHEALREERCRREDIEQEKGGWERRGQELENVLRIVKEEVLKGETEKDDLIKRVEENDRNVEELEERALKAEERFADALAARASSTDGNPLEVEEQVQRLVAAQIDAKIEAVSRELHAVYKEKHERKVATLKKSYEARSEKKCAELNTHVASLEARNIELEEQKHAGPASQSVLETGEVELRAQIEEQNAAIARLEKEMQISRQYQTDVEAQLKQERIEKGDLVAAVDEMLALQMEQPTPAKSAKAIGVVEDFRKSISANTKPTGLRPPGESKIGRGPASGLPRGGSIGPSKSRMLANIERMGRATAPNE